MSNLYIPSMSEILAVSQSRGADSDAPHLWDGLVGGWPFQEGGGSTLHDVSGYGNHGTLTNMDPATDWVVGEKGWALDFDGSDDYVNLGQAWQGLQLKGSIVVSATLRQFNENNSWIIGLGHSSSSNDAVGFRGFIAGTFGVQYLGNGTEQNILGLATSNGTYHFAVTWDASNNLIGYTNGNQVGSPVAITYAIGPSDLNQALMAADVRSGISAYTNCIIFQAAFYNRVLASSEIQQVYVDPGAMYRPRVKAFPAAVAPLALGDYGFENASPYDVDEVIGTVTATGGTAPYVYSILTQTVA